MRKSARAGALTTLMTGKTSAVGVHKNLNKVLCLHCDQNFDAVPLFQPSDNLLKLNNF